MSFDLLLYSRLYFTQFRVQNNRYLHSFVQSKGLSGMQITFCQTLSKEKFEWFWPCIILYYIILYIMLYFILFYIILYYIQICPKKFRKLVIRFLDAYKWVYQYLWCFLHFSYFISTMRINNLKDHQFWTVQSQFYFHNRWCYVAQAKLSLSEKLPDR